MIKLHSEELRSYSRVRCDWVCGDSSQNSDDACLSTKTCLIGQLSWRRSDRTYRHHLSLLQHKNRKYLCGLVIRMNEVGYSTILRFFTPTFLISVPALISPFFISFMPSIFLLYFLLCLSFAFISLPSFYLFFLLNPLRLSIPPFVLTLSISPFVSFLTSKSVTPCVNAMDSSDML